MDELVRLPGFVFPVGRGWLSLVGSKCESNEFSSGEEESFGSESRVNTRRVFIHVDVHSRGFRYDGGMELGAWLL